jgi:hypothetical protein
MGDDLSGRFERGPGACLDEEKEDYASPYCLFDIEYVI